MNKLTRDMVKAMTETEKDKLIYECFGLKIKASDSGLTAEEYERFGQLIRCGMLLSEEKPYKPITPERDVYLRYLARIRNATAGWRDVPLWLNSTEEVERVRCWERELVNRSLAERMERESGDNKHIRQAMEKQIELTRDALTAKTDKAILNKTEKIIAAMRNPPDMQTHIGQQWIALRVTSKGEAVKTHSKRWNSLRDIAAVMGINYRTLARMESGWESRPDVRAYLARNGVPLRKERRRVSQYGIK